MQTLPSVSLYIRITESTGKRRYERVKRGRNPQMCGPHDVYCLHFYQGGKRKWETVGTDLPWVRRSAEFPHYELPSPNPVR